MALLELFFPQLSLTKLALTNKKASCKIKAEMIVILNLNVMTAVNCILIVFVKLIKTQLQLQLFSLLLQLQIGCNIPGGFSYFGQNTCPVWNMGTIPFKWVGLQVCRSGIFFSKQINCILRLFQGMGDNGLLESICLYKASIQF